MKKPIFKSKTQEINVSKILYILSIILVFGSYYLGIEGRSKKSPFLMAISYLVSIVAFVFVKNRELYKQLFPIYLVGALIWDIAYVKCIGNMDVIHILLANIGVVCLNIPIIYMVIRWLLNGVQIKSLLKSNCLCMIICFIFVVFSLSTLSSMARLDTNIYYNYFQNVNNWNLGLDTINAFFLGGHQCIGYALSGAIGIWLCPNSPIGIRIINIILVIITIFQLYSILKKFLKNEYVTFAYTLLFSCNPLILGIIYEINLDLPMTCFYIWVLSSLYNRDYITFFATSMLLVLSKETGIILLFGICVGWLMYIFIQQGKKAVNKKNICILGLFAVVGLFWLSNQVLGLLWRQKSLSGDASYVTMDSFAIQKDNVIAKTKELFCVNFSWMLVILFICCLIICIIKHCRISNDKLRILLPTLVSFLLFVIFQYVYITYVHLRYIMPVIVGEIIILAVTSSMAVSTKKQGIMVGILAVCFFAESFWTVDPITQMAFPQIDVGSSKIMTTRVFTRGIDNAATPRTDDDLQITSLEMTQSAIYNRQFMYFELLFQKILQEINYNNETLLVISPTYEGYDGMTRMCFFGDWYSEDIHYDKTNYRLTSDSRKPIVNCIVWGEKEIDLENYKNVYYIDFPYNKNFDNDEIIANLQYSNKLKIEKYGWDASVYQLK